MFDYIFFFYLILASYKHYQLLSISGLVEHPGYGLLIVGYSLGGGVASLITEELMYHQRKNEDMPNELMIRCMTYGAPPTYSCPNGYKNPNIFAFKNHNDCVRKCYRLIIWIDHFIKYVKIGCIIDRCYLIHN